MAPDSTIKKVLSEEVVIAVTADQGTEKKQGADDRATGGSAKPSKLKKRKKVDTKIPQQAPICHIHPTKEPLTVTSAATKIRDFIWKMKWHHCCL